MIKLNKINRLNDELKDFTKFIKSSLD